jgi:hypothetical protein
MMSKGKSFTIERLEKRERIGTLVLVGSPECGAVAKAMKVPPRPIAVICEFKLPVSSSNHECRFADISKQVVKSTIPESM